jgi:hypothetical protein
MEGDHLIEAKWFPASSSDNQHPDRWQIHRETARVLKGAQVSLKYSACISKLRGFETQIEPLRKYCSPVTDSVRKSQQDETQTPPEP